MNKITLANPLVSCITTTYDHAETVLDPTKGSPITSKTASSLTVVSSRLVQCEGPKLKLWTARIAR